MQTTVKYVGSKNDSGQYFTTFYVDNMVEIDGEKFYGRTSYSSYLGKRHKRGDKISIDLSRFEQVDQIVGENVVKHLKPKVG